MEKLSAICLLLSAVSMLCPDCAEARGQRQEGMAGRYPRAETLVLQASARHPNPRLMNMYMEGNAFAGHAGLGASDWLWYVNADAGRTAWWLAEGFQYDPGYAGMTIRLRKGVRWSDGRAFSADDVVFTFVSLMKNPGIQPAFAAAVAGAEKVDAGTVHLKFQAANPRFHLLLGSGNGVGILPRHVWEGKDPRAFGNWPPVHAGPYRLVTAGVEEQVFQRIDGWWGEKTFGKPAPKYVTWRFIPPFTDTYNALSSHAMDAGLIGFSGDFSLIREKNEAAIAWSETPPRTFPGPCLLAIVLNQRVPPWNDPDARRALSLAVPRAEIAAKAIWAGLGDVGEIVTPPYALHAKFRESVSGLLAAWQPARYDPVGAAKGADGVLRTGSGKKPSIDLIVPSWDNDALSSGQIVADSWKAAGIEATLKPLGADGFDKALSSRSFQAISITLCGGAYDPYFFFEAFRSDRAGTGGANHAGYADPALDGIVDRLVLLPYDMDDPAIRRLYMDATEILLRDAVIIPVGRVMSMTVKDTWYWKGWATSKDPYAAPGLTAATFFFNVLKLTPTGRK